MSYDFRRGGSRLVVSIPHAGTWLAPGLAGRLTEAAVQRPDTDWHLPRLYDFLEALDATVISARLSRYVVDLNRPPDDAALYPGRLSTGLCPRETFDGQPVYREGREPDAAEVSRRIESFWKPYHRRLANELARVRSEHGVAVLWDAHSIVSAAPRLFEGRLPDFNLGTAEGASCDANLAAALHAALQRQGGFTSVRDGRFKGGYITRHYGKPAQGVHAVQMEMAQAIYMDEQCPYGLRAEGAARVRKALHEQLRICLEVRLPNGPGDA